MNKQTPKQIYISIGSNINRYLHITAALDALYTAFGDLTISKVYESEAVGFEGDDFLNLVVGLKTTLSVNYLDRSLKEIENNNGRLRDGPRFSARTLDLDILTVDELVGEIDGVLLPREEILENAFVLLPLVDVAANTLHPVEKKTYQQLWDAYDQQSQKLWPVDFSWQDKMISHKEPL